MSIFRRRAAEPDVPETDPTDTTAEPEATAADQELDVDGDAPVDRTAGPFDASEVDGPGERIDLGSVWIGSIGGAELRLEVDQASETVSAIQLIIGPSAAQIQAFAAPRSGGVWREVRQELSKAIETGGGTVEEVDGPLGKQLNVRMPQQGPDGRTVFAPARFVGVDGPRWFLRAVLSGQAAVDDEAAEQLIAGVRQFVVHRGQSPMAPREMLPLTLPPAAPVVEEQAEPEPEGSDTDGTDERYTRPDLNPFERGPEITEVR